LDTERKKAKLKKLETVHKNLQKGKVTFDARRKKKCEEKKSKKVFS